MGTFNKLERPYADALEMAKVKLEEDGGPPTEYPELSFDPNAMAAMFQDPNMVQLMASLFTAKEKQAVSGNAADASIGTCFTDPAFIAKLFQPATMQVVAQMQNAMQQLTIKSEEPEFNPLANPYFPGHNFSNSFGNFLLAQQENPELQYRARSKRLSRWASSTWTPTSRRSCKRTVTSRARSKFSSSSRSRELSQVGRVPKRLQPCAREESNSQLDFLFPFSRF